MAYQGKHSRPAGVSKSSIMDEESRAKVAKAKRNRRTYNIMLVLGIALMVVALAGLGRIVFKYYVGDKTYSDISSLGNKTLMDQPAETYQLDIDWDTLKQTNPDIVAWIQIPYTPIDYPVVQTTDNDYYLHHDFEGSRSSFGCIFLDYECAADFSGYNSLLYGHHMRNGSMFAELVNYTTPEYLEGHPYVYLATPDGVTHRLLVCAVLKASGSSGLRQTQFVNEEEYRSIVQAIWDRNEIETDITVGQVGHLYELVTCSYEFTDARTIVYAVEVDVTGVPLPLEKQEPIAEESAA